MKQVATRLVVGTPQEIVDFVDRWAPFGGGDEDIFPTFGIHPSVFYWRAAHILKSDPGVHHERDPEQLIAYCVRKAGTTTNAFAR